jgi:hypothetical protein
LFKFGCQGFFRRQCQPVFSGEDFVVEPGQRVAGDGVVFLGAEDEADGGGFAGARPVFAGVVQIEVHLAGVGVGEWFGLEVNHQQAAQGAVKEQEVHAIPLAADAQAALASDEGEVAAEFEQEGFEVADEGVFEFSLGVIRP